MKQELLDGAKEGVFFQYSRSLLVILEDLLYFRVVHIFLYNFINFPNIQINFLMPQ